MPRKSSSPSIRTYPYVVRYKKGGATFMTTKKGACEMAGVMREHSPRIYLRTTAGESRISCKRR